MPNIQDYLTTSFSYESYKEFISYFLKDPKFVNKNKNDVIGTFKDFIDQYEILGTYKDKNEKEIVILTVKIKHHSNARQAQRNFIAYLLKNVFSNYCAALVAFYDDDNTNWKLSLVTVETELNENGVKLKFKPAKRFTFLVGQNEPTKTYTNQLKEIFESSDCPTIEAIIEAFSVNKLSKDFYNDYKKKFNELVAYLSTNENIINEAYRLDYKDPNKFVISFAKKTLGQIVFLHFLQKKGWLGVSNQWGDGDKHYLINSTKIQQFNNFFDDFLEPLFYSALNQKRENDLYLNKKIPFLNGGLFQPIENYNWQNISFDIPNNYWFNKDETGLLDILSQYNFTVDEADPTETEMAVDPEMLGKIFESLLDVSERQEKGAFYTPREIVHYMCEEALAARISNMLNISSDLLLNFIHYGDALEETEFIESFATQIDDIISKITIVDPAVGSGAFLVGMLNQIVKLRTNLQQFMIKKMTPYEIKFQTIHNSLYGVDLEYDAVEIAKLRLWLSLIVDQTTANEAPQPLPNLNFHLRIGNSLVKTFKGLPLWSSNLKITKNKNQEKDKKATAIQLNLFNADELDTKLRELSILKDMFYSVSNNEEKNNLYTKIEQNLIELIRAYLYESTNDSNKSTIKKLKNKASFNEEEVNKFDLLHEFDELIKQKTKPFFLWELEFTEIFDNGGFDIVIANPPYVQLQNNGGELSKILQHENFQTLTGNGDLYCLFYEKGLNILKENGILTFITSNKWMRAKYGEKLREFLANHSNPLKLIDLGPGVFESATVDVNILIAEKSQNELDTQCLTINDSFCSNNLSDYFKQYSIRSKFDSKDSWLILNPIEMSIKKKIEENGVPLSEWDVTINRGVLTGCNEAFVIDKQTRDRLISEDPKSAELIRPIILSNTVYDQNLIVKIVG